MPASHEHILQPFRAKPVKQGENKILAKSIYKNNPIKFTILLEHKK
jgi:hypothetical protein